MNLTNYTQTEQAREDVKSLLADSPARDVKLGTGRIWHKPAGHASIKVQGFDLDTMLTLNKRDAWNQVRLSQRDDEMSGAMTPRVSAYYRPDGDRYVVTDLGEGVRALRLKGVDAVHAGDQIHEILAADWVAAPEKDKTRFPFRLLNSEIGFPMAIEARWLPDALCRVMLASLKVSEVQP